MMDITEINNIITAYEEKHGYSDETIKDKIVLHVEEFGEFVQAYLNDGDADIELCDCVAVIFSIIKRRGFDFEKVFKEKYQVV